MPIAYEFLTTEDVNSRIRDEHRQDLVDLDADVDPPDPGDTEATEAYEAALEASEAIELSCESMAIAKVRSALYGRYDTDALFDAEGDARKSLLVLHVLNVFVYLLYRRINPRKIPQEVKDDHDETLAWLDRVAGRKESPDFPAVTDDTENAGLPRFGGGQPDGGHYF
jgi:hypothetical protein